LDADATPYLLILNSPGELVLLIFRRDLQALLAKLIYADVVLRPLVNFGLPAFEFLECLQPAVPRLAQVREMREDKPRVQHDEQNSAHAYHQALFKGTQVQAIQVAAHSASDLLSSSTQCQVT